MVRDLIHDPILLGRKSEDATVEDLETVRDLADTLLFHKDTCVGMAANMIGIYRRVIAFLDGDTCTVMLNPRILQKADAYETEEGCLSLLGGPRKTVRYRRIKVEYQNEKLQTRRKTFQGWTAQIIQHEVDHCDGILI